MIDVPNLLIFMTALAAVYMLPGPDMALVITISATQSLRSGLFVAAGLALSRSLHVALSSMGLTVLFYRHPILFEGVRWLGASYLMWLTWRMFGRHESAPPSSLPHTGAGWSALQRGLMTNLLNPKALMFCALFLPQFISAKHEPAMQYMILGSLLVALGILFDIAYAFTAATLAGQMSASPVLRTVSKLACGGIFSVAAIRLVMGER